MRTGGVPWRSPVTNWARRIRPRPSIVAGCIWIRAWVGDGPVGRIATGSHARSGAMEPLRTHPPARACNRGGQGSCGHRRPARRCVRGARTRPRRGGVRWQAARRAATVEVSQSVSAVGKVLREKTQVNIGGARLPLTEMSNLAATVRDTTTPITRQKVGRKEPCPCGSGTRRWPK